jgi:trans-aconitate methyltransferase
VKDWYEEWFGEEYLALYPHRDDEEAREVAALIAGRIDVPAGSPALDLGCGSGRHQRALAERWWTVGLDLSHPLLHVARRKTITVSDEDREFIERVRLFEPEELCAMLERCGFDVVEILGAYDGRPRDDDSPRAILIGARR